MTNAPCNTTTGKNHLVARAAAVRHSLVIHNKRNMAIARVEATAAAKNFLEQRLWDEQQRVMDSGSKRILEATSCHDLIIEAAWQACNRRSFSL